MFFRGETLNSCIFKSVEIHILHSKCNLLVKLHNVELILKGRQINTL